VRCAGCIDINILAPLIIQCTVAVACQVPKRCLLPFAASCICVC
jgi:hypothetical protein